MEYYLKGKTDKFKSVGSFEGDVYNGFSEDSSTFLTEAMNIGDSFWS